MLRFAAEYLLWLAVFSSLVIVFALAVLSPAFAEVSAEIEVRKEKNFGRLVLTFDRLPTYKSELASGVFVLSFDETVNANVDKLPVKAAGYVAIARRDPDGRAFRFALSRTYKVNLMEAGKQLFIDILPANWQGLFPGLPDEVIKALAKKAAEAEARALEEARQRKATKVSFALKVRLARHPTFTRIVFDWNKFVKVDLSRSGKKVLLKFDQKAKADLTRLNVDPPPFLKSAKTEKQDKGMAIVLMVDKAADVRGFREGLSYVVDLSGGEAAAEAAIKDAESALAGLEAPKPDKKKAEVKTIDESKKQNETRIAGTPEKAEQKKTAPREPSIKPFKFEIKPFDIAKLTADQFGDNSVAPGKRGALTGVLPTAQGQPKQEAKQKTPPQPPPEKKAEPKPPEKTKKADDDERAPNQLAAASDDTTGSVKVRVEGDGPNLRLTFPFRSPVAAAAFRRGRTIWLVFDTASAIDTAALRKRLKKKVANAELQSDGSAQYVRLELTRPWLTYLSGQRNAWTVTIGDMIVGRAEPLSLQRSLRADRRSVITIPLPAPGRVHWLKDPIVGDRLAVVTAFAPARHIAKPQDFVEFSALPTAHGIAIRPRSEDVGVRLRLDEVLITRHRGLTLSAGNKQQYVPGAKSLDPKARQGFLDFAKWRINEPSVLTTRLHELQRSIAMTPDKERNWLRLNLARIYLANDLTPEAVGLLKRMKQSDSTVESDPAFNVMRGAAHILMGRQAEARKDLEVHALANDPDAALWRGLLAANEKDWPEALKQFKTGIDAVESYRPDVRARFHLAALRAALESSQLTKAAEALEGIPSKDLPASLRAEADLLKGRYLVAVGQTEEALQTFDSVLKTDQRPSVAEAEFRTIALLLQLKKIPVADAIKQLERLQLIWRGDDTELGTLRLLAGLYVGEGRFRDAFSVMKNAVIAYPKAQAALQIQDDMKSVFRDLFLRDGAKMLEPVEALSLYYDYRELTPVGRTGDEMIRRLADRLTKVDLLDQAAELLDHQVHKRLKGAARAQVATRLAMVHLLNRKPELALKSIRQTRQAGLPADLLRSRGLLEARALSELGRAEAAVEILSTLKGEDVERLKGDALWNAQLWRKAGEQLEKILGNQWQDESPLNDRDRFDVLRAAIAYSLADEQLSLNRLSKKFYAKMLQTKDAEAFTLVTQPVKGASADFRRLAREVAATDTLDAFMEEFRKNNTVAEGLKPEPAKPIQDRAG